MGRMSCVMSKKIVSISIQIFDFFKEFFSLVFHHIFGNDCFLKDFHKFSLIPVMDGLKVHKAKKQGWLLKVKKNRRFFGSEKSYWFALDEKCLYYFSNDTATVLKGSFPLDVYSECELSTDSKKQFRIFSSSNPELKTITLSAQKHSIAREWVESIKLSIEKATNVTLKYGPGMFRKERSLFVKVGDAKNLPEPISAFCTILIDGVQRARTPTTDKVDNPGFFQEYDMELDNDASELCIYLKCQKNKSDGTVGFITRKLSDITSSANDEWFPLISPDGKNVGSMRVTLKYFEVTVLPDQSYDNLFACLVHDKLEKTKMFTSVAARDAKYISDCLVKAFEMRKLATHFVKEIITAEIQGTGDVNIIFRGNSVATKSLDIFMKLVGTQYLLKVLKPIISEIYQGKKSCELDAPNRCKENQVQGNLQNLKYFSKKILDSIFNSFKICPASFRNVFRHIQETVVDKFPNDELARYTAPGGFIFLRFFCPAILNPSLFDLIKEHPSEKVNRDFTLIAKTVQNIANLATFGKKEPFMECMNPFITEYIPVMKKFINELCSPPSEPIDEIPYNTNINFGREMAKIHNRINEAIPDIKLKYGEDNKNVIELIDVVEKLNEELHGKHISKSESQPDVKYVTISKPPGNISQPSINLQNISNDQQPSQPTTQPTIPHSQSTTQQTIPQQQESQNPETLDQVQQPIVISQNRRQNRRTNFQFTPLEVPDSRKFWA